MKKMLKMQEVAEIVDRPITTIWRWARAGILPAVKMGKFYMISEEKLNEFLKKGTQ